MADKKLSQLPVLDSADYLYAIKDGASGKIAPGDVGGGGSGAIDGGTITSPVASLDIELPSGYVAFELKFFGLTFDVEDSLNFRFSFDGGATYKTSDYESAVLLANPTGSQTNVKVGATPDPTQGWMNDGTASEDVPGYSYNGSSIIYPGTNSLYASVETRCITNSGSPPVWWEAAASCYAVASGRATHIRCGRNFADAGEFMTAGDWRLYGII